MRKSARQLLVPYHFSQKWDIIPNRVGSWEITDQRLTIKDQLRAISNISPDVVVSGDCMAAIGAHRSGLPLVWFDAHGDFHTLATTYTGHLGGMPFAMLCGVGDQALVNACGKEECEVPYAFHVGGSAFDSGERERMVKEVTVVDKIDEWPGEPIHLHLDTDVISANDLPSSIHPAGPTGMLLSVFWQQLEMLLPCTQVLSIKTYDPRLDAAGIGEGIVLKILEMYHELRDHAMWDTATVGRGW